MENKGYRIPLEHVKIGEKIHISDYFYAKRMFQKGYYAYRFAYLLSDHIHQQIVSKEMILEKDGSVKVTLIGYKRYSNLLLSSTERFLKERLVMSGLGDVKVYHEILAFEQPEDQELIQVNKNGQLFSNRFVVIPISTTLSTQIKIEKFLETYTAKFEKVTDLNRSSYLSDAKSWLPYYSMILVSPKDMSEEAPFYYFWKNLDRNRKLVTFAREFPKDHGERTCQYMVNLITDWQLPENCKYCYPENVEDEICLFDTDANSQTTPQVIFAELKFPKPIPNSIPILFTSENLTTDSQIVVKGEDIQFGNLFYRNTNINYFLNVDNLIIRNLSIFKTWTAGIKNSSNIDFNRSTLLISPISTFNTSFISLVNEYIFNDTASIVRFNPTGDFESNFTSIFQEEIVGSEQIFYVDDYITTSNAVNNIQGFINQFKNEGKKRTLNGAIIFVSQLDEFNMNSLPTKVIDSFITLNVPTFSTVNDKYFLDILFERNSKIYGDTVNHEVKKHINRLRGKLKRKQASVDSGLEKKYKFQNLKRLAFQELITSLFRENQEIQSFLSSEKSLDNNSVISFRKSFTDSLMKKIDALDEHSICRGQSPIEVKIGYLKVLTSSPYVSQERIRKIVFKWILLDLVSLKSNFEYEDEEWSDIFLNIDFIKFLVRRGANLSVHFLVHYDFLNFLVNDFFPKIRLICDEYRTTPTLDENAANVRIQALEELELYFVSCYKLLLHHDESASVKLEENILSLIESQDHISECSFIRVLYLENNGFLRKTFNQIIDNVFLPTYYLEKLTEDSDRAKLNFKKHFEMLKSRLIQGIEEISSTYSLRIGIKISKLNSSDFSYLAKGALLMIYLKAWSESETIKDNEDDIVKRVRLVLTILGVILYDDVYSTGSLLDLKYRNEILATTQVNLNQLFQFTESENPNLLKKNHLVDLLQYLSINGFRLNGQQVSEFTFSVNNGNPYLASIDSADDSIFREFEKSYTNYYYKGTSENRDLDGLLDLKTFPDITFKEKLFDNKKLSELKSVTLISSSQSDNDKIKESEASRISMAAYSSTQKTVNMFGLKIAQWCFENFHVLLRKTYSKGNLSEHINNLDNLYNASFQNLKNDIISSKITHKANFAFTNLKGQDDTLRYDPIFEEISKLVSDSNEIFDLVEIANQIKDNFKYRKNSNLKIKVEGPDNGLYIVDKNRILYQEIITNIFSNSLKYAEGYTCKLSIEKTDEFVIMSFENDGPDSIPQDEISLIFDNEYRSKQHSKDSRYNGQGKGLHIVKQIVRSLNGSIHVMSVPGKTEFRVITYAG